MVVSIERHVSMNQCVQKHAERPGVHLWPAVRPSIDDLWGGVQRTPAKRLKKLVAVEEIRQTEVCNLFKKKEKEVLARHSQPD